MTFDLMVVLGVVALGVLWILRSPLLKAIVLDTLSHPNRAADFEIQDGGVVTVTPKRKEPAANANGKISYVEAATYTIVLRQASVVPANWPRLIAIASSEPQESVRELQPIR